METETKILIVGLGSIGKRHTQALLSNGISNIAALRSRKKNRSLAPKINKYVTQFYDEEKAFEWNPSHLIISNPTHLHLKYLEKAFEHGLYCFVEKPVIDSYDLLDKNLLEKIKKVKGQVGYNLRFHGVFRKIRELLNTNVIGNVIHSKLEVGHYLPFWHKNEDYRKKYYARKDMGGGVLRTLSHELDIAKYLFGHFKYIFAKIDKVSSLDIDVDDCVDILASNQFCSRTSIHLDFLSPSRTRKGKIIGEFGSITYDYFTGKIILNKYRNNCSKEFKINEEYQKQYIRQMKEFISMEINEACSISQGIEIDRLIGICEKSNKQNTMLNV